MLRRLGMVGALSMLSACVSLPPADSVAPDVALPGAWSVAEVAVPGEPSPLAQWWLRFDDAVLVSLIAQASRANTSVGSAQAQLRQARALRDVAAAGLAPVVTGSASAQHATGGGSSNHFSTGLDASWELDLFGARRSALNAADAVAAASAATLADVRVSSAAEVALDYISLRGAQARLAIAGDNLLSQGETLHIARWRMQAGLVTALEVEQARAAVALTSAQLPPLRTSIDQSAHALAVLTGQAPAALAVLLVAPAPVPQASRGLSLGIPAETLRQRPDVRAAELQVAAALARVTQAEAQRRPDFRLGASLGLSALTPGALASAGAAVSTLLANVSLPLLDGGALRAQVRAQQAALDQARIAYRAAVLAALKDVEDALVALRNDRERLLHLEMAAEAATNAALMARQRFSSGLVDFQTVLDTQRVQLANQDGVAGASADVGADHVRLYKALGGGWSPEAGDAARLATDDFPRTQGQ